MFVSDTIAHILDKGNSSQRRAGQTLSMLSVSVTTTTSFWAAVMTWLSVPLISGMDKAAATVSSNLVGKGQGKPSVPKACCKVLPLTTAQNITGLLSEAFV